MLSEARLLSEYIAERYPGATYHLQFRVGSDPDAVQGMILDEAERRLMRNLNRRVDALVLTETEAVVIEATMFRPTEKIGRLQEYKLLFPASPEFAELGKRRVVYELVTAQEDAVAEHLCAQLGFRYVCWQPMWMEEFWAVYPERRRRALHSGTLDILAEHIK